MIFLSSSPYPVKIVSSTVLGGDRVTENALHGVSIKQFHGWNGELHRLQPAEEVKALLSLLDYCCSVFSGGQLTC